MVRFSKLPWILALVGCVLAAGVAGFIIGRLGAPDVAQAQSSGERAGTRAGTASGIKEGAAAGKKAGWKAGFDPAKAKALKSVRTRTLRAEVKRAQAAKAQQDRDAAAASAAAAARASEQAYDSCMNTYGPDYFPPGNYTWSALVAYCENQSGFDAR